MIQSESIAKLTEAKVAAQAEIRHAIKDSKNEHFKSKYADLANVLDATRVYAQHGIAITQSGPALSKVEGSWVVTVTTKLAHTSGEWEESDAATPLAKADAQGVGSACTYLRRYSLAAMCGIAQDDDDAESAVGRGKGAKKLATPNPPPPAVVTVESAKEALEDMAAIGKLDQAARDLAMNYPDVWLKVKGFAQGLKSGSK